MQTPERKKAYNDEYYQRNKEKLKERARERSKLYYKNNREKKLEYQKKYTLDNYEEVRHKTNIAKKRWAKNNPEKVRQHQRDRMKDPLNRAIGNLRSRIHVVVKNKSLSKKSNLVDILGCSFEDFFTHLSDQFTEGMSWDNYGEWHIDHIRPVSEAETMDDVVSLNHYTNLQPLWAIDNLKKYNKHGG
jgi:hypothetical protein